MHYGNAFLKLVKKMFKKFIQNLLSEVPVNLNNDKVNVKNLSSESCIINIENKAGKITEKFIKK